MRKRFFIILIVCIVIALIVYLIFFPSPPLENNPLKNIFNPEQGKNETPNGWSFPNITFPWSSSKPSGNSGSGGSGGSSGSKGGGGGGGSAANQTEPPRIKNNYTLSVSSTHNLEVFVSYTINDIAFNETTTLPFSLEVQEDTYVCISETTGSGTIRWLMENGSECPFSDCNGNPYGCNLYIDGNHSIVLRQYS